MSLRIQAICVDSIEPAALADFWREVLGWQQTHADVDEIVLEPPPGSPEDGVAPDLLFLRVTEEKVLRRIVFTSIFVRLTSSPKLSG